LARELEVALEAATAAGQVLSENFGREQAVRFKGEVDLVTEVDERAERVIREVLLGAFPKHGVLGEEGGWSRGGDEEGARWIVDPLDGTTNYAHGLPLFCVSIALERSGEVVLGWCTTPRPRRPTPPSAGAGPSSTDVP
jgi:myo-inositol-1(or 4)-monophosphatase